MAAILGFVILAGTAAYVIREWERIDKTELALSFALPIWLTVATLPFIFGFSLLANYETTFSRIDFFAKDDPRARRRAKLALLTSYHLRNRELHRFAGLGPQELARSTSWREARRIVAFHRAKARLEEAEQFSLWAQSRRRLSGRALAPWPWRQPRPHSSFSRPSRSAYRCTRQSNCWIWPTREARVHVTKSNSRSRRSCNAR